MNTHDELNDIRRRAGLQEQARPPVPTVAFKEVYHVGDMNAASKKGESHEGAGLSFSFHPEEWSKIARLGGELWVLTKPTGGTFIDFHSMSKEQRNELVEWGVQVGYVEPIITYIVTFEDEDGEEMMMQFATREEAEHEAEAMEEEVEGNLDGLKPTPAMVNRIGFVSGLLMVQDHLATLYAEDNQMDGVWWNDELDVLRYSAPRGVIVPSMVNTWNADLVSTK